MVEGSLEVKLPTVWTDGKADRWESRGGKSQRREEERRSEKGKSEERRKAAKYCVFPMICGSGRSKSRLAKAAGAEPSG